MTDDPKNLPPRQRGLFVQEQKAIQRERRVRQRARAQGYELTGILGPPAVQWMLSNPAEVGPFGSLDEVEAYLSGDRKGGA
jgi:hypothetical protein